MYKNITIICILLSILTGCTNHREFIAVLSSDLDSNNSEVTILDKELDNIKTKNINESGLTQISYDEEEYKILSSYNSKIITLSNGKVKKQNSSLPYPLFNIYNNNWELMVYNFDKKNDINFYTYELKKSSGELVSKRLEGIPFSVQEYGEKIYTVARNMNEPIDKQFSLNILSTKDLRVLKKVKLDIPYALSDMNIKHNKIYLTMFNLEEGKQNESKVLIYDLKSNELKEIHLKYDNGNEVIPLKEGFLIKHNTSKNTTTFVLYNDNYRYQTELKINKAIIKTKYWQDSLYYLTESKTLEKYNLKQKKVTNSIKLKDNTNDFLIINQ